MVSASASRTAWRDTLARALAASWNRCVRHTWTVADELITDASALTRALSSYDTTVAHPARVYNYWLGGKDNFEADREVGEQTKAAYPGIVRGVQAQRVFLAEAVRYLVKRAGVRPGSSPGSSPRCPPAAGWPSRTPRATSRRTGSPP